MRASESFREAPARPSLGVLFGAAVIAYITVLFVEHVTWARFTGDEDDASSLLVLVCSLVLVCFGAFACYRVGGVRNVLGMAARSGVVVMLVSCVSIALCGFLYWNAWDANVERAQTLFDAGQPVQVELTDDPVWRDYGIVSNARINAPGHTMDIRVLWPDSDIELALSAGHSMYIQGSLSPPKANEGGRWNHQNGFVGMVNISRVEQADNRLSPQSLVCGFRDASSERIKRYCSQSAGLLAGVLLGNRTLYANTELEQAFKTTGLAHLMAVSGTHLAIVTMLVSALLNALRMPRLPRNFLTLFTLALYVALTCFAPSAIRAYVMCAVALLLGGVRHRKHVLSGLSLCVFAFIGLSPTMVFSLGFALSVLAVCGLVIFNPLIEAWVSFLLPSRLEQVSSAVATTLSATFLTIPVTVPLFAQLPVISPLANLVIAPIVTAMMTTGLFGLVTCAAIPPLGVFALQVSAACASFCSALVQTLADVPLACIPLSVASGVVGLAFVFLFAALWIFWPLPGEYKDDVTYSFSLREHVTSRVCAACALALPFVFVLVLGFGQVQLPFAQGRSRIVMIDVGQGDCMLIESDGHRILVDTGEKGDVLQRGLARQGVTHLDAIVITHKDADHCGALKSLVGVVGVDNVYVHADLLDKDFEHEVLESARWATGGREARGVRPGSKLNVGEFTVTLLAPESGGESENEDSLVNLLEYDAGCDGSVEARGLLTGDAEAQATERVTERLGTIDVLKVPHHGSRDGVTADELALLHPSVALIGVGAGNKYGHPTDETLALLEEAGTHVFRTDLQGDITVSFSADSISVTTQKG